MKLGNFAKRFLADCLIQPVHVVSRLLQKATGRRHGLKHHYYLMNLFRSLGETYWVTDSYPNPLDPGKKLTLKLDLSQNTQQWLYRSRGLYELEWIRRLACGLKTADCFVDVGAHVGVFALTLAQIFPGKKVIAVEAYSKNYELLVENIRLNGLQNVEPHFGAAALTDGEAPFYLNPLNEGGGSLLPMKTFTTGGITRKSADYQNRHPDFSGSVAVPTFRLDSLIAKKSVVKIDVEGSEIDVLTSAENAFKKGFITQVVMEVGLDAQAAVLQCLQEWGFECSGDKISYGGSMFVAVKKSHIH